MKLESIYDRGIKFHHYCNTAYPLRPNPLALVRLPKFKRVESKY